MTEHFETEYNKDSEMTDEDYQLMIMLEDEEYDRVFDQCRTQEEWEYALEKLAELMSHNS